MKKYFYFFALASMALASCSSDDVIIDEPQNTQGTPIGFHVYADKVTRANSADLQDFYKTFNVYGWKKVSDTWSPVFADVTNEYFATDAKGTVVYDAADEKPSDEWNFSAGWYYENVRYWDKMATNYQFDAYTPISESSKVACDATGKITYGTADAKVDVDPKNLMETPATALAFTGFDRDFMTATATATTSDVQLTFKHELAKLNIKLALSTKTKTKAAVTVTDVQVLNLGKSSYFNNKKSTEAKTDTEPAYVTGWATPTDEATYHVATDYQLNGATAGTDKFDGYYVMEQLLIPQTAAKSSTAAQITEQTEPCVYVEYKIGEETFKGFYALANIFIGAGTGDSFTFAGGNQYTLTITVGPDPIHFAASVTTWAEEVVGNLSAN